MVRDKLLVPDPCFHNTECTGSMGPIDCPETWVRNYCCLLRTKLEERGSQNMGCIIWVDAGDIFVLQLWDPPTLFSGYHRHLGCQATRMCSTELKMSGSVPPLSLMPSSYAKGQLNPLHLR